MPGKVISRMKSGNGDVHSISSSFYGVCDTAADIATKKVIISNLNIDKIALIEGMLLTVKFINGNTINNPKLILYKTNLNNENNEDLNENNENLNNDFELTNEITIISNSTTGSWIAGVVISFVYDGANWVETSSGILSITNGGTGATTIENARTNLNAASLGANIFSGAQTINNTLSVTNTATFNGVIHRVRSASDITQNVATTSNGTIIAMVDKNDQYMSQIRGGQWPDGKTGIEIVARNKSSNGETIRQNNLQIFVDRDGNNTYSISGPANFRSAINAASLASNIFINGEQELKSTNITQNVPVTDITSGSSKIYFEDSQGKRIGWVRPRFFTDGNESIEIAAQREVNNSNVYNRLGLQIDSLGKPVVSFNSPATQKAWLTALDLDMEYNSSTISTGVWTWIKLPNNLVIANYRDSANRNLVPTQQTPLYWVPVPSISFPITFSYPPAVSMSQSGSSGNFYNQISQVTTTATGQMYIARANATAMNGKINLLVVGIQN